MFVEGFRKAIGRLPAALRMAHPKFKVVFVLGPPGSGKGTQCVKIEEQFHFVHLSAGDLLRAEQDRPGSTFGQMIKDHIKDGTIVPVEVTCKLIENAMTAQSAAPGFLVDGFPRNEDNLQGWNRAMGDKTDLLFVLFLECPEELCVQRCLGRNQGRADDNRESLEKRIHTYCNHTRPIIDHYAKMNLVRSVDASKTTPEVFEEIKKAFAAAHQL